MIDYLRQLDLGDYIGSYDPRDVVVLTDSGYDNKKIETAIANKRWNFIIALGKTRSVKSETLYLTTPKSRQWCHIATFFRHHRRLKWTTIWGLTNGAQAKRMEFRSRDTIGYLRYVGKVQLVCSEPRKRPDGRRKYFACNDMRVSARQIIMGYRLRWAIELFHKDVKQRLGFEDVATSGFDSVMSHVHWCIAPTYCCTCRLRESLVKGKSLGDTQRQLQQVLANNEKRRVLQLEGEGKERKRRQSMFVREKYVDKNATTDAILIFVIFVSTIPGRCFLALGIFHLFSSPDRRHTKDISHELP